MQFDLKRDSLVPHIGLDIDRRPSVSLRTFADVSAGLAPSCPSLFIDRFHAFSSLKSLRNEKKSREYHVIFLDITIPKQFLKQRSTFPLTLLVHRLYGSK